jgi:Tfp pilus assembly protein PilF
LRHGGGRARALALGLGCFLVNLFPVLGFFDIYGMRYAHVADHWQYLACTSILALAAAGIASFRPRIGTPATAALAALLLALLSWSTWQQSRAYVDRITLWRHTLEREPGSLIANNNVGVHLLRERRYAEAASHFRRAIDADPSLPESYLNLGLALDAAGDRAQAETVWRRVLDLDPEQAHALHHLAVVELERRRFDEAEALLRRALRADPKHQKALAALAWLYRSQGRPEAFAEFSIRAGQPPRADRVAGGRRIATVIWSVMGLALAACAGVAAWEARHPERAPRNRGRPARARRRR